MYSYLLVTSALYSVVIPHYWQEYNDDWWIGRVVGQESHVVFIPRSY